MTILLVDLKHCRKNYYHNVASFFSLLSSERRKGKERAISGTMTDPFDYLLRVRLSCVIQDIGRLWMLYISREGGLRTPEDFPSPMASSATSSKFQPF
jgi:hypothetical protein